MSAVSMKEGHQFIPPLHVENKAPFYDQHHVVCEALLRTADFTRVVKDPAKLKCECVPPEERAIHTEDFQCVGLKEGIKAFKETILHYCEDEQKVRLAGLALSKLYQIQFQGVNFPEQVQRGRRVDLSSFPIDDKTLAALQLKFFSSTRELLEHAREVYSIVLQTEEQQILFVCDSEFNPLISISSDKKEALTTHFHSNRGEGGSQQKMNITCWVVTQKPPIQLNVGFKELSKL